MLARTKELRARAYYFHLPLLGASKYQHEAAQDVRIILVEEDQVSGNSLRKARILRSDPAAMADAQVGRRLKSTPCRVPGPDQAAQSLGHTRRMPCMHPSMPMRSSMLGAGQKRRPAHK